MQIESKGVGLALLSTNDIARLLQDRWGIRGEVDSVVPGTSKVFRVETSEQHYYTRLSFSRRGFSADQVIEFINFLGSCGGHHLGIVQCRSIVSLAIHRTKA